MQPDNYRSLNSILLIINTTVITLLTILIPLPTTAQDNSSEHFFRELNIHTFEDEEYDSAEDWEGIFINEFQALNDSTITDPQDDYDDWVELYNSGEALVDLGGFYLTDDLADPDKWAFPEGTVIDPGAFLIVWTDNDDGDEPGLHTSFRLSGDGEQVGLFVPDGDGFIVVDTVTFGEQRVDWSYGREEDGNERWIEFEQPTPGQTNNPGFVDDREPSAIPDNLSLTPPYPNPFNSHTKIRFHLPETGNIDLTVFDVTGRLVVIIMSDYLERGEHLVTWEANDFSPGIYFVQLQQGDRICIHKALLVK